MIVDDYVMGNCGMEAHGLWLENELLEANDLTNGLVVETDSILVMEFGLRWKCWFGF